MATMIVRVSLGDPSDPSVTRVLGLAGHVDVFTREELRKRLLSQRGGRYTERGAELFFEELDRDGCVDAGMSVYYQRTLNVDGTEPEGGY